jgi:NADH:ubiquinone oxidoreductase subunit 2 (subunit N)
VLTREKDRYYQRAIEDVYGLTFSMLLVLFAQQLLIADGCNFLVFKKYFFFNSMVCVDTPVIFMRFQIIIFSIMAFSLIIYSIERSLNVQVESVILFVIAVYTILFLVASYDSFLIYVCLEIIFLCTLGLTVFCFSMIGVEAALKYFIQNIIISAVSLIGLGFIFYFCKSTNLYIIKLFIADISDNVENKLLSVIICIIFVL